MHSVGSFYECFLNHSFFLVLPLPEALVLCQLHPNIGLNVMSNKCHLEIELIAVQQFEMEFDLRLLLTNGQQVDIIEAPSHKSFNKAQDFAPVCSCALIESIKHNICMLERPRQFFEHHQKGHWGWL